MNDRPLPVVAAMAEAYREVAAIVFAKDCAGRYLFVNRSFERLAGRPASEIVGAGDIDLFPPDIATAFSRNDAQVLGERRALEFEETALFQGERRLYATMKSPLFDGDGALVGLIGVAKDVTARQRTSLALQEAALAVSSAGSDRIFQELTRYLSTILDADYAFIGELMAGEPQRVSTRGIYGDGAYQENMSYVLATTPCRTVVGHGFRLFAADVGAQFPADGQLSALGLKSYAGYPLCDPAGRPIGVIAVLSRRPMQDEELVASVLKIFSVRAAAEIERQRAEAALRASEASYRAIFDAAEDAIFVHDADTGEIVDANPKACRAYGYSYDELCALPVDALCSGEPPYTGEEAARLIAEARRSGRPLQLEWHRRNKDGSLHWDELVLKMAEIAGTPRLLAFTREITARKLAEDALRRSEARLRATVEAAFDCVIGMDAEGRVIEFNPAAERVFGHARSAAMGRQLAELIVPARHREPHSRGLARYLATGHGPFLGRSVELTALHADGHEFPVELAIGTARAAEGDIFIGYLRDITARKRAEVERNALEAQLRQAQKMEAIGHLAGGIAHDFNNLLAGILGYVVLGIERAEDDGDAVQARYLEQARLSCERARDLIGQMLTFSRGQRGAPRLLELGPLVVESLGLARPSFPAAVAIHSDFADDVPLVFADPVHIEQVLLNLCLNARDAMGGGGTLVVGVRHQPRVKGVCCSCRQPVEGDYVELSVTDSGPGIAPAVMDRMFEPFFSTKGGGKGGGHGSGMGLAMVHGIVHEQDGHVLVDTGSDGTRFRVLLRPRAAVGMASDDRGHGRRALPAGRLAGRVLLVDDEPTVLGCMGELLQRWGVEVCAFSDPLAARARLVAGERIDLLLTDQAMPGLSGVELARDAHAVRPALPVVLYSGNAHALPANGADGLAAVLDKPVDPQRLFALLARYLPVA